MFISSFEKMREKLLNEATIVALIETTGTNNHPDVFDANAGWILANGSLSAYEGSYFKLDQPIGQKDEALLEAIANPDCGWFYHRPANSFKSIPGTPIAYWASDAMIRAFDQGRNLANYSTLRVGMQTGDNGRFLRLWWEVSEKGAKFDSHSTEDVLGVSAKWVPYNKGGQYRKWFGNLDYLVNWENDGYSIRTLQPGEKRTFAVLPEDYRFKESVTWGIITSGRVGFRFRPKGSLHDIAGMSCFAMPGRREYILGFCNSIVSHSMLTFLAPTLNIQVGDVGRLPIMDFDKPETHEAISNYVSNNVELAKSDWDSFETSWDFKCHPLV